jgi:4-amino-4-deoxy-L-arabinose transferase-like glycosyltransferase
MDPTEGRYAEISREMVVSGDWIVPRLEQDLPFWGKPPLMFWIKSATFEVLGANEFSARFPSFVLALFSGGMAFLFARRFWGGKFALRSSLILATTALFFAYAGYVATDPALLAMVTLAMVSFSFALEGRSTVERRVWGGIFFAALGGSVLAKGLVGLVLIASPIFVWTLWMGRYKQVFSLLPWVWGLPLFFAISVPWHILCEIESPGFLEYYVVGEHIKRFLISDWDGDLYGSPHQFPRGFIWLFLMVTTLPWSIVLLVSFWKRLAPRKALSAMKGDPWLAFAFLWFFMPLFFFTFSRNIMFTYVLPTLPPFSILCLHFLTAASKRETERPAPWFATGGAWTVASTMAPAVFLIAVVAVLPGLSESRSQKILAAKFSSMDADSDANLVYTDTMPYSADFYLDGRALDIPTEDLRVMMDELKDDDQDYYAIKENDLDNFPLEGFELTTEVGRFGDYILRREFDANDLPDETDLSLELDDSKFFE